MDDRERRLLIALAWMAEQYLRHNQSELDSYAMHAGEIAIGALAAYRLVEAHLIEGFSAAGQKRVASCW